MQGAAKGRLPRSTFWYGQLLLLLLAQALVLITVLLLDGRMQRWVLMGITAVWLLCATVYLPIWHHRYRLTVTDSQVMRGQGVVFWRQEYLARDRILYLSRIDTPLAGLFGLSALLLTASGSRMLLVGLDQSKVAHLERQLRRGAE